MCIERRIRRYIPLTAAAGLLALVAIARAQYFPLDQSAESPAWWTLDEKVSPAELRNSLRDREKSRERLRASVAAGTREPLSQEQQRALVFYHDPAADPALEPMWHAFHFFANYWLPDDGRLAATSDLSLFGVSAEGTEVILARADAERLQYKRLVEELAPAQSEYLRLAKVALDRAGADSAEGGRIRETVKQRDAVRFAEVTGAPLAVAQRLAAAAGRDPALEAGVASLPTLRNDLSEGDWQGLRRFLKEQVANRLAPTIDFEWE